MRKILIFIITIFSMISCQFILKMAYGIKKPKEENRESLIKYLNSIDLNHENLLLAKDIKSYNEVLTKFDGTIPEALLFDSKGNYLIYKEENEDCNAGLFSTIPNLNKMSKLKKSRENNILKFLDKLTDLDGREVKEIPKADYYLFINWAKFIGRLNKDHVKIWEQLAKNNKSVNIKVFKVNLDNQIGWSTK